MKNKLLSVALSAVLTLSVGMAAFADGIDYSVNYDYSNSLATVTVNSQGDEYLTLQVLDKDKTFTDISQDDIIYIAQQTADEAGKYSFKIDYDVSSYEYNASIASSKGQDAQFTLLLIDPEDLDNAVTALNTAAKEDKFDDFAKVINDDRLVLNYRFKLSDDKILSTELNDYFAYVKANELKSSEQTDNAKVFNTFIAAYHLNNTSIDTIKGIEDKLYTSDTALTDKYNSIVISDEIAKYFTGKLSGNSIHTLDDYDKWYKKALVLTGIRYAKGYGEVESLLDNYGSLFGITDTAKSDVYTDMAGKDYTAANLKSSYEALVDKYDTGTSSSPSKKGGGSYSMDYTNIQTEPTPVKVDFEDIDGVQWASEAIHALTDKGIINGTSAVTFSPDDNVTREQFAKILVIALGLDDNQPSGNAFGDVSDESWYCKYVNIAADNGIVKGIGNGMFGVGSSIIREDMCVMLHNALKLRGNTASIVQTTFDDRDDISAYALEAVETLYGMGAVNGMSDTTFAPGGFATRAQAAKIVYGVLDKLQ
ncbi:MAG: S-layer homology domain-containing protein [Clostridia bacterium]|nr:S-layer homology domain-containing protein [Clostridia bacterium]